MSAKSVRLALIAAGGNVSAVADAFEVSRTTVYNWIRRYMLRDLVAEERDTMFDTARMNINLAVQAGDLAASQFVLTHMPVEGRWTSRSELTGKDGEKLIPADIDEMLRKQFGTDAPEVMAAFIQMMREKQQASQGEAREHADE